MANPRTIARIAARIQERAAHCLQFELRDPRATFVTITGVEVSSDLALAKIRYSVLGDEGERSKAAHMLEHATGFVQRQVASILHMRRAPTLRFVYDDSIEHAAALDRLIREARDRDRLIDPSLVEREAREALDGDRRAEAGADSTEEFGGHPAGPADDQGDGGEDAGPGLRSQAALDEDGEALEDGRANGA